MLLVKNGYIKPSGNGNSFQITVDRVVANDSYFSWSLKAAEEIADQRIGKLYLLYSGGVDSEFALNVFLFKKIPIVPVIIKLNPNYNNHDVDQALEFCRSKNLDPLVVDIDFDHFVRSGRLLSMSIDIGSSIYHRAATAHVVGLLSGTVLCGDGEPYIKLDPDTKSWNVTIYEHDYAVSNFYEKYNIHGTPHFNRYLPEMMFSFLKDSRIFDLANNLIPGKLSSESSKFIIYNKNNQFNIKERPKYHGYELIETSEIFKDESFSELARIGVEWNGCYSENYFKFMGYR